MGNFSSGWYLNMSFVVLLLFVGIYCLLTMRNLIKLFIGVEVIAKAVTLALIATGYEKGNILLSQSLAITFIVVEVSVVATALAIIINVYRHTGSLDIRKLTRLKG
jgi:NADH:ubiquinone oxidoreductase subunit K